MKSYSINDTFKRASMSYPLVKHYDRDTKDFNILEGYQLRTSVMETATNCIYLSFDNKNDACLFQGIHRF